jgi:hypothetical protein
MIDDNFFRDAKRGKLEELGWRPGDRPEDSVSALEHKPRVMLYYEMQPNKRTNYLTLLLILEHSPDNNKASF